MFRFVLAFRFFYKLHAFNLLLVSNFDFSCGQNSLVLFVYFESILNRSFLIWTRLLTKLRFYGSFLFVDNLTRNRPVDVHVSLYAKLLSGFLPPTYLKCRLSSSPPSINLQIWFPKKACFSSALIPIAPPFKDSYHCRASIALWTPFRIQSS